jgi:hypothetical protein
MTGDVRQRRYRSLGTVLGVFPRLGFRRGGGRRAEVSVDRSCPYFAGFTDKITPPSQLAAAAAAAAAYTIH